MSIHKIGSRILVSLAALAVVNLTAAEPKAPSEPAEPKASPAVQRLLDQATSQAPEKAPGEELAAAERALAVAQKEKDAVGEAQAQRLRARALSALNRNEEAMSAWQAAVTAWAFVGDGPGQVEALAAMAIQLDATQPDRAAALRSQALSLAQSEANRPLASAEALRVAGQTYFERGALNKAREFWAVALLLRERHAPNSLEMATSLNDLGRSVFQRGDLAAARELYQRALAIQQEKAPNSLEVAGTLNNLGSVARQQGDLAAARELYKRALAICEGRAPNSRDVAVSLNNLGNVADQQGDLAAAREFHQRALAIRQEKAPNSLDVAANLHNLGNVAWRQGDLAAAREFYQRGLAIHQEKAPNSLQVAASLIGLGLVADQQGDLAAARELYQRGLAIRQEKAPNSLDVAGGLNNLGAVAYQQGDFAAARDFYQRALAIYQEKAPNSPEEATSLNNLGFVAEHQGDLAAAREFHQRALAIRQEKAPNSLEEATSLNNLGFVAEHQGDLAAARKYYQKALAIRQEKAPSSLGMAETWYRLGELAEKQGDLPEAKKRFERAWQLAQNQMEALSGDEARQALGTSTHRYADKLIRSQIPLGELQEAFATLEGSRAQALQQLLLEKQGLARAAGNARWSEYQMAVAARNRAEQAAAKASVGEILAQRDIEAKEKDGAASEPLIKAQEARKLAAKKSEEAQSAYTQARVKADALWADIQKSLPRALTPPMLALEQARHELPPGALFVAFSVGEERTYVFLLRSETPSEPSPALSAYTLAIANKKLQQLVNQFRLQVISPSRRTAGTMAGRTLFAELFPKEVRKEIGRSERLLISPDGPLWEVPFAALVTNASGSPNYLGATKSITYTPSLALLAQIRSEPRYLRAGNKLTAVVLGNPIFNRTVLVASAKVPSRSEKKREVASLTPAPNGFGERSYLFDGRPPEPLPETEREAVAVARLYGIAPLLREEATESALRQRIEKADVVHLATHGYLHPVRPMSSGVLLTIPEKEPGPGETDNDGALQAWEIFSQLKLKAELVVLSACETGRGKEVRGEGLVGLTRALQYAGARSIVASQWKVADQSTATFMMAFHRALRQGLTKDEALRQAMAQLRQNPATSHPYYWAPFVLIGDSGTSQ